MKAVREDQHGTLTGYRYGCRCVACHAAHSAHSAAYRADHRDEIAAYNAAYSAAHREEIAASRAAHPREAAADDAERRAEKAAKQLMRRYGLLPGEWEAMLAAQGSRCAACGSAEPGGKYNKWATDHCHETGRVRGILCHNCNAGLGHFRDDPERLMAAIKYLAAATL